ncbi:citrate/2-methylcitrate synthase [Pyrococcus sp. ST04]|uniref:citrate/2-methylcitrate synthase n=1 Tax=Pyrococcus sp. ST04 TaxID=1183377 RepID=UPI0002605A17|nr:citrate/2-methylcitrate synthase [Pyrococcus sp. ST04]AFK21960.1 citrate synthase [Pyrococcus sp. ST04]
MSTTIRGLENVYIDQSSICYIDGRGGRLYYRGYSIEELAELSTFEEVTYLLWFGKLPTKRELKEFSENLVKNRKLPSELLDLLEKMPRAAHPMGVLRTAVSFLGNLNGEPSATMEDVLKKGISITAKIPTIVATMYRLRNELEPIEPSKKLSHAANFLYMLHGEEPPKEWERAMDVALILYAEHEINASTLTVMTVGSTLSDYYSAIVAGIGALKGPLHGGAVEGAIKQFMEIGSPEKVEEWFFNALKEKRKIMGAGHRVYKTYDPRARIFKKYAKMLGDKRLYAIAEKLEALVQEHLSKKGVSINVDYWSGIVFHAMRIPIELYTTIFAMGRIAGWTAHLAEYISHNRLIRPRLQYVGEVGKKYVPIEMRE